ncbi:DUF6087 family protein [Kitasatospora purpeofusca]|uniref:DUF6087 family protein n=1 Tax=Kitasatospora purpeofusca TaxID=67352 RepID=UPI000A6584E5|nr:DUF6087 family protein [Kitasatospora purpeofusca]MCX4686593.1 DUF6087 family protein [Kitasatospora purpeofusca]
MDAEEGPPADQPLAEWYAERARRRRAPGTRDAITLAPGPRRAAHLFQDVPRLVVEWDGHAWQPVAVAENYAEAYPLIVRQGSDAAPGPVFPQADTPVSLLRKGTGRHRKPDQ